MILEIEKSDINSENLDLLKDNSNNKTLNLNFRKRKALKGSKLELLKLQKNF